MKPKKNTETKITLLCAFIIVVAWVSFWMGTTLAHRTRIQCEINQTQIKVKLFDEVLVYSENNGAMKSIIGDMKKSDEKWLANLKGLNQTPLWRDLLEAPFTAPMREHKMFYACAANQSP